MLTTSHLGNKFKLIPKLVGVGERVVRKEENMCKLKNAATTMKVLYNFIFSYQRRHIVEVSQEPVAIVREAVAMLICQAQSSILIRLRWWPNQKRFAKKLLPSWNCSISIGICIWINASECENFSSSHNNNNIMWTLKYLWREKLSLFMHMMMDYDIYWHFILSDCL